MPPPTDRSVLEAHPHYYHGGYRQSIRCLLTRCPLTVVVRQHAWPPIAPTCVAGARFIRGIMLLRTDVAEIRAPQHGSRQDRAPQQCTWGRCARLCAGGGVRGAGGGRGTQGEYPGGLQPSSITQHSIIHGPALTAGFVQGQQDTAYRQRAARILVRQQPFTQ